MRPHEEQLIILQPVGRVDNTSSAEFQDCLLEALAGGTSDIIIDFAAVDHISSGGFRALMTGLKQKPANRRIAVASLNAVVQETFSIARFHEVIPVFRSIAEAALAWEAPHRQAA